MKEKCKLLGSIIILIGTLSGIVVAIALGKNLYGEQMVGLTLGIIASFILGSLFFAFILYALSDVLECLGKQIEILEQISPALKKLSAEARGEEILADGGWKCPMCGKVNRFYTVYCSCGQKKEDVNGL